MDLNLFVAKPFYSSMSSANSEPTEARKPQDASEALQLEHSKAVPEEPKKRTVTRLQGWTSIIALSWSYLIIFIIVCFDAAAQDDFIMLPGTIVRPEGFPKLADLVGQPKGYKESQG